MLELVFNSFVTLLVVLDPLGMAPLFVGLTHGRSEAYKREAAIRGVVLGAMILFLFAFAGQGLLSALGIGVPAFRIAGGALLFLLSIDMVFAHPSGMRRSTAPEQREANEEPNKDDISVFPLAIPLIAGPGSLTTVLLYTGNGDVLVIAAVLGVLLVVLLLVLASLLLAVQFVLDGIRASFAL